jgi:hypothetical protein
MASTDDAAMAKSGNVHVLIIRAWVEDPGPDGQLRVRIIEPGDVDVGGSTVVVTTSVDEARAAVSLWLERVAGSG